MSEQTFQLVVSKGPKPGQTFPLLADKITIGRDPMSDISIADPEISRHHARLEKTAVGYQLQDMGSTNGSYIDGERLGDEPVALQPGQSIVFGSGVVLKYQAIGNESDMMATMIDPAGMISPAGQMTFPQEERTPPKMTADLTPPPPPASPITSPPPDSWQQAPPPPPPPVMANEEEPEGKKRRAGTIIAVILLLFTFCCCAFFVSGYYWWGDILLQYLESAGF